MGSQHPKISWKKISSVTDKKEAFLEGNIYRERSLGSEGTTKSGTILPVGQLWVSMVRLQEDPVGCYVLQDYSQD